MEKEISDAMIALLLSRIRELESEWDRLKSIAERAVALATSQRRLIESYRNEMGK